MRIAAQAMPKGCARPPDYAVAGHGRSSVVPRAPGKALGGEHRAHGIQRARGDSLDRCSRDAARRALDEPPFAPVQRQDFREERDAELRAKRADVYAEFLDAPAGTPTRSHSSFVGAGLARGSGATPARSAMPAGASRRRSTPSTSTGRVVLSRRTGRSPGRFRRRSAATQRAPSWCCFRSRNRASAMPTTSSWTSCGAKWSRQTARRARRTRSSSPGRPPEHPGTARAPAPPGSRGA